MTACLLAFLFFVFFSLYVHSQPSPNCRPFTYSAGLCPTPSGNPYTFLNGIGQYVLFNQSLIQFSESSIQSSGLLPALNGSSLTYLNGQGQWVQFPNLFSLIYNNDTNTYLNGQGQWVELDPYILPPITESLMSLNDVSTYDSSTSRHGFLPKLNGNSSTYLNGGGIWSSIPSYILPPITESLLSFSNNTLLDSTTSRHGLLPRLSGDSKQYLNGNGQWVIPTNIAVQSIVDTRNTMNTPAGYRTLGGGLYWELKLTSVTGLGSCSNNAYAVVQTIVPSSDPAIGISVQIIYSGTCNRIRYELTTTTWDTWVHIQ